MFGQDAFRIDSELYGRYGFEPGGRVPTFPHVEVIEHPAALLTLDQAKRHLRIFETDFTSEQDGSPINVADENNADISDYVLAAQMMLDGPHGSLDRCIGITKLRATFDNFDALRLPYGPIISVDKVTARATHDTSPTVPASTYMLDRGHTVMLDYGASWPTLYGTRGSVTVEYTAGFAKTDGTPSPPAAIVQAIKLLVGHFYEHRLAVAEIGGMQMLPLGVDRLIAPFRAY